MKPGHPGYERYDCYKCGGKLMLDCEALEWSCPFCSRRYTPEWTDRQGALTRVGPPVEARDVQPRMVDEQPLVALLEQPEEPGEAPTGGDGPRVRTLQQAQRKPPGARTKTLVPGLEPLRLERGLRQEELARLVGVHRTTLTYWESGQYAPPLEAVIRLVEVLETSYDSLLHWRGEYWNED